MVSGFTREKLTSKERKEHKVFTSSKNRFTLTAALSHPMDEGESFPVAKQIKRRDWPGGHAKN
jgi:hypothetical protein